MDKSVLIGRLTIIITCAFTLSITIVWGVFNSLRKAPKFVMIQIGLITVSNIAGLCYSLNLWYKPIYTAPNWQLTYISIYFSCSLAAYWFFACQYLFTSRNLDISVDRMYIREEQRRRLRNLPSIMDDVEMVWRQGSERKRWCWTDCHIYVYVVFQTLMIPLTVLVFVASNHTSYSKCPQYTYPYQVNKWIGTIDGLKVIALGSLYIRIMAAIMITVALFRITRILRDLKAKGLVKTSSTALNLHILFAVVDVVMSVGI